MEDTDDSMGSSSSSPSPIVVHNVVQRGTDAVNTSCLGMLAQGITACDSTSYATKPNILLQYAVKSCETL